MSGAGTQTFIPNLTRSKESVYHRLLIGHTIIAHEYLFEKRGSNKIPPPHHFCGDPEETLTLQHILVDCTEFRYVRCRYYYAPDLHHFFNNIISQTSYWSHKNHTWISVWKVRTSTTSSIIFICYWGAGFWGWRHGRNSPRWEWLGGALLHGRAWRPEYRIPFHRSAPGIYPSRYTGEFSTVVPSNNAHVPNEIMFYWYIFSVEHALKLVREGPCSAGGRYRNKHTTSDIHVKVRIV